MKGLKIFLLIAAGCLIAGPLNADIYEWTDENGVKHFTNYTPPDNATILIKFEELPYDEVKEKPNWSGVKLKPSAEPRKPNAMRMKRCVRLTNT